MTAEAPEVLRLDDGQGPALELLRARRPRARRKAPSLLMVHGAYTDAWSWAETFMPFFRDAGYDVWSVSLRGHGQSEGHERLDLWGIGDYVDDLRRTAAHVGEPLTLFGSSMGGLLVQRWLAAGHEASAAVTIGSVPPTGLAQSTLAMAFGAPHAFAEVMQVAFAGAASRRFLDLLAVEPRRADDPGFYRRHVRRESARALWEMTWAPKVPRFEPGCPVLAVHGEADRMVPPHTAQHMERFLGAEVMRFPGIGHVPMMESRWHEVASGIGRWLAGNGTP